MVNPQEGIFYNRKALIPSMSYFKRRHLPPNSTFGLVFLRIVPGGSAGDVKYTLKKLWKVYDLLRIGKVTSLPVSLPTGNLSVLIGYGRGIFELKDINKSMPENFSQFLPSRGGGNILDGCGIKYSKKNPVNLGLTEGIVIQFIADTQLPVYRAIVETWNQISFERNSQILQFSRFYSGFQRDDRRSWLGFHDEISNMSSVEERKKAIFIHPLSNDLRLKDYWTKGGTYMAFLRIEVNLKIWQNIDTEQQELIVGRDKETGIPLLGVDRKGRPLFQMSLDRRKKKITSYHSAYLDHPDYFTLKGLSESVKGNLDLNASTRVLSQSHIGRARHIDSISSGKPSSRRIYRQGFEFIEPITGNGPRKPFMIGLNFLSFQNDPSRLFFILSDPNWMGHSNFGGESSKSAASNLLSVHASGVFYVPPDGKPFPGASIFK